MLETGAEERGGERSESCSIAVDIEVLEGIPGVVVGDEYHYLVQVSVLVSDL